jgi:tetratricopeptide (TPR) repeat protein
MKVLIHLIILTFFVEIGFQLSSVGTNFFDQLAKVFSQKKEKNSILIIGDSVLSDFKRSFNMAITSKNAQKKFELNQYLRPSMTINNVENNIQSLLQKYSPNLIIMMVGKSDIYSSDVKAVRTNQKVNNDTNTFNLILPQIIKKIYYTGFNLIENSIFDLKEPPKDDSSDDITYLERLSNQQAKQYINDGRLNLAIESLKSDLESDPLSEPVLSVLADLYLQQKKYSESYKLLVKLSKLNPNDINTIKTMFIVARENNNFKLATKHFFTVFNHYKKQMNEPFPYELLYYSLQMELLGPQKTLISSLQKQKSIKFSNILRAIDIAKNKQQYQTAIILCKLLLEHNSNSTKLISLIIDLSILIDDKKLFYSYSKKVNKQNHLSRKLLLQKAEYYYRQEKFKKSLGFTRQILTKTPADKDALYLKGLALFALYKNKESILTLIKSVRADQHDIHRNLDIIEKASSINELDLYYNFFIKILNKNSNNINLYFTAAQLHARKGEYRKSQLFIQKYLNTFPNHSLANKLQQRVLSHINSDANTSFAITPKYNMSFLTSLNRIIQIIHQKGSKLVLLQYPDYKGVDTFVKLELPDTVLLIDSHKEFQDLPKPLSSYFLWDNIHLNKMGVKKLVRIVLEKSLKKNFIEL